MNRLVVKAISGDVPAGIKACTTASGQTAAARALATQNMGQLAAAIDRTHESLPAALKTDRVVNTVLEAIGTTSAYSLAEAGKLSARSQPREQLVGIVASRTNLPTLTEHDFKNFAQLISEHVMRDTAFATSDGSSNSSVAFWDHLKAYYDAFYKGEFVNYFGQKLDRPKRSLTVSNEEIANAVVVFIELIFDESRHTPVWTAGGKYFPGGGKETPTVVKLKYRATTAIKEGSAGCGINVAKASTINYLAHSFANAATTEIGLSINTFGGFELGLGILGKVNIGDNQTLSTLVQASVSEIVGRLTVEFSYPILASLDFGDILPDEPVNSNERSRKPQRAPTITTTAVRKMSTPFITPNTRNY